MKPQPFAYVRPDSVTEAIEHLLSGDGDAKLIAGGQSLVPLLNLRMARPSTLVDIVRLPELGAIAREGDQLVIGAAVRQRDVELSPVVQAACPLLPLALRYVGHLQIRNLGTIGGSLAHADPAAELPCVAVALDAVLVAQGPDGTREVAAADFFLGPFTTALGPEEILTQVRFPVTGGVHAFVEFSRRGGDFAMTSVAASGALADGIVSSVRLAASGAGPAQRCRPLPPQRGLRRSPRSPGGAVD